MYLPERSWAPVRLPVSLPVLRGAHPLLAIRLGYANFDTETGHDQAVPNVFRAEGTVALTCISMTHPVKYVLWF